MNSGSNDPSILDVREVPIWHRLTLIVSAVGQLTAGGSLELIVDLDPWPLRKYLESMCVIRVEWTCLESGPEVWRVRLSRTV